MRRPHGLSGEVSVEPVTDFPDRFAPGSRLQWSKGYRRRSVTISSARWHGPRLLLSFEAVDGPENAAALAGGELSVTGDEAMPPPPDFYYSHEVEGWRCEDAAGKSLGRALRLERTAAGPLLVIETTAGREALIPFVRPILADIDRSLRRIILDPPEGLLELGIFKL